jgi:26S proteasome regulatory subunit N8
VPFEEDEKDPSVWFLDHNYVESMNDMFKKINAREKLIGWYHTGPKLRASDLEVNELFKRYTPNPLLVIVDVQPKEVGVPTDAYFAVEEIKDVSASVLRYATRLSPRLSRLTLYLGWHNHLQDLCPHSLHNRSRRSRRDWCRTPAPRYPRCRRRHTVYPYNLTTTVATGPTSAVTRYRPVPPKGHR